VAGFLRELLANDPQMAITIAENFPGTIRGIISGVTNLADHEVQTIAFRAAMAIKKLEGVTAEKISTRNQFSMYSAISFILRRIDEHKRAMSSQELNDEVLNRVVISSWYAAFMAVATE